MILRSDSNFTKLSLLALAFFLFGNCRFSFAQKNQPIASDINKETFTYAKIDTTVLKLDVYTHAAMPKKSPCIIFVFGGGFITGKRDEPFYNDYFNALVHKDYVVVSISYRLGLFSAKRLFTSKLKPLKSTIDTAVVDLYDATKWVIAHHSQLGIDTTKIILSGSSAGAVTVLQADFEKRNKTELASRLSPKFEYAGVVSFAGAVLTFKGPLRYKTKPAPTLMFHGTHDKMIFYNRIVFFNRSLNGSNSIASVFRRRHYAYYFYRERGRGHEVAALPMRHNLKEIFWFMDEFVFKKKNYQIEESFNDMDKKPKFILGSEDIFSE